MRTVDLRDLAHWYDVQQGAERQIEHSVMPNISRHT